MEVQKKCLECERPVFGRVDKKFCSDGCRNAYNNKNKAAATNYIRNVNNLLAKNRRILLAFNPSGKAKKHRDFKNYCKVQAKVIKDKMMRILIK